MRLIVRTVIKNSSARYGSRARRKLVRANGGLVSAWEGSEAVVAALSTGGSFPGHGGFSRARHHLARRGPIRGRCSVGATPRRQCVLIPGNRRRLAPGLVRILRTRGRPKPDAAHLEDALMLFRTAIATKTLRVALAGGGRMALQHATAIARHRGLAELVGVADPSPAARAAIRRVWPGVPEFDSLAD